MNRNNRLRNLVLVIVCAALAFGGTFTCKSDSESDEFTRTTK